MSSRHIPLPEDRGAQKQRDYDRGIYNKVLHGMADVAYMLDNGWITIDAIPHTETVRPMVAIEVAIYKPHATAADPDFCQVLSFRVMLDDTE